MLHNKMHDPQTVDELLQVLEPVEEAEICTDYAANVRCELQRIRRNTTAILNFVSLAPGEQAATELGQIMADVRRQCLRLNSSISSVLLIVGLVRPARLARATAGIFPRYARLATAAGQMWNLAIPPRSQELRLAMEAIAIGHWQRQVPNRW